MLANAGVPVSSGGDGDLVDLVVGVSGAFVDALDRSLAPRERHNRSPDLESTPTTHQSQVSAAQQLPDRVARGADGLTSRTSNQ